MMGKKKHICRKEMKENAANLAAEEEAVEQSITEAGSSLRGAEP